MSEDRSSNGQKSWLGKLTQAFAHEPKNRQELLELLRDAHQNKLLDSEALAIVEGAIQVADLQVRDIMVPRSQVITIRELLRQAVLIPESKKLNVLLREFRQSRNHMAIVIDEYGGVAGLVTIEDVLEQIVGDIDDEHDEAEDDSRLIAAQDDGQFVVDALTPIADFNERFGADFDDDEYDTIGGLVTDAIGHLPEVGEELALGRFRFTVARADARRLLALHVAVHADH